MLLTYLIFDAHESTEGVSTFEAMASVNEARWPALQVELAQVLAWCHRWGAAQGAPAPMALDDGGEWDHELSVVREQSEVMDVVFDPHRAALLLGPGGGPLTRFSATLVLSGREAFAADFAAQFLGA
jgi:hypothetical protein